MAYFESADAYGPFLTLTCPACGKRLNIAVRVTPHWVQMPAVLREAGESIFHYFDVETREGLDVQQCLRPERDISECRSTN